MSDKLKNIIRIFLPLVLGGMTSLIINPFMDYMNLNKPPLSPPKIVFPIVWTILYLLIGIAYYLYRKNYNHDSTKKLYYIGLFLNYFWTILFFVFKLRGLAIICIIALLLLTILLMRDFYKTERRSFYLLIPYIIWIIIATYLNIGVYILN